MPQENSLRLKDRSTLKCMIRGSGELARAFEQYSTQTNSPQLRDEFQKLAAAARNQQLLLREVSEGKS